VEDDTREVKEAIVVVEAEEDKKRKNFLVKKIGVAKVKVRGKDVVQATQELSGSSIAIMQRNANRLGVLFVVRSDTMQGIVDPKIRGKRRPIFSQKMLNKKCYC